MRWKPLAWFFVSLLCFVGAVYFWKWGERRAGRGGIPPSEPAATTSAAPTAGAGALDPGSHAAAAATNLLAASFKDPVFPYRLRNTPASLGQLMRSDTGLLLENALVDTSRPDPLPLPDHLRAQGDPGTYIVQARGLISDAFRQAIAASGGTVVSYVPNNAFLVRASAVSASALKSRPEVQSVLPFEPYYKLKGDLLKAAVERTPLPEASLLTVVLFDDSASETKAALASLGVAVLAEDRTPFGSALQVQVPTDGLAAVAGLSGVQMMDRTYRRAPANDLVRSRLGVQDSSAVTNNYLGLTGAGVRVQVVDSGVDLGHPDFTGRLLADPVRDPGGLSLRDTDGHGTHVAGTLAGDGRQSDQVTSNNVSGSVVPVVEGQFRGMAPGASILSLAAISGSLSGVPDSQIQESAAENGALISNNSWRQLGNTAYDIVAASYDAAVRDALPLTNGSQPVLFVFASGNEGFGNDDGDGAIADTIGSPATAKNLITVGAIEQLRDLTNEVVICEAGTTNNCITNNPPFEFVTDSDDQVASFSSRGNVGVGLEGESGRFKPDVVAPGAFLISTRSTEWATNAYYYPTNILSFSTVPPVQPIFPGELFLDQRRIEPNSISVTISVANAPGESGPLPEVGLPLYVRSDRLPTTNDVPQGTNIFTFIPALTGVDWYFGVGNPTDQLILVQITYRIATTNLDPVATKALQDANATLEPWYRYERGTSMAAPAISGTLALMQEYLVGRFGAKPSPALLKALLINGSRSVSSDYRYGDADVVNDQGWGIFNLPNILPAVSNSAPGVAASALHFYEQSVTRALATGQQQTRTVTVDPAAANERLRFTLVWTDPPGSPLVATKLVNDLDLVVTNLDTGEVYLGNNFPTGSDFTEPLDFSGTNAGAVPPWDAVNNVENVFLPAFVGTNLSVTVVGRRVNVNALPTHPNNTVQDYVLVISSGSGATASALTVVDGLVVAPGSPPVTFLAASFGSDDIEGVLLQNQTAGENSPLLGSNAGINDGVNTGVASQWRFYGVTNTFGFTNAAFVTFLPATLSLPRMGVNEDDEENATRLEADIDLYVSQDPGLTTLNPVAINNALKSRTRAGTESIVLSNAAPGVYYVGVKSEDHEAANYSLFSAFSLLPFSEEDEGGVTLRGVPLPGLIPDGSPQSPKAALVLAVTPTPISVRRVIVTNEITHLNIGDLVGNLSHSTEFAVLNNHTFPLDNNTITNFTYIYEDLGEGDIPGAQRTDGPGSLRNFSGKEGVGVWLLSMVDDALSQTGQVDNLVIRLERSITNEVERVVQPFAWIYDLVEIPPDATNFTICVDLISGSPRPVELYILRGDFPTFALFDLQTTIDPPGDCASISTFDVPPLQPGTYYFGIYNPNPVAQDVRITVSIGIGLDGRDRQAITAFGEELVVDDAVSYAYQFVEEDRRIAGLEVGLVLQHPRVSDLVTHLVSPKGKRILLVENRGGTDDSGYGGGALFTNVFPTTVQFDPPAAANATTNTLTVGANRGTLIIDYDFLNIEDRLRVYYDDQLIEDTGLVTGTNTLSVDFGPGLTNVLVITVNEGGNSNTNTAWSYTALVIGSTLSYLVLTEDTDKTTTPIKFAVPPLGGLNVTPIGPPVFADGFEGVGPGNYAAPSAIGPWQVVTNNVDVFATGYQGALPPPEGNQFLDINGFRGTNGLALPRGVIQTVLNMLTPGRNYQLTFAYARNPDSLATGVLPSAQVSIGSQVQEVVQAVGTEAWTNLVWLTLGIPFTATDTNLVLQISSLTPGTNGVLFDNFSIQEAPQQDRYFLPEESLKTLIGDSAQGLWTLEMWDNRAGASNGPPTLESWQLRFIYETVVQTPVPLEHGVPITNTIPAGGTFCLSVDVPNWALFATNELIFATAPVDVWFNQTTLPSGTNVGNVQLLALTTGGTNTLSAASVPPLIPGERYFLCLTNPNAVEVTFAFQVEFDITALTNGIPLSSTLGTNRFGGFIRYFSYDVSTNNPTALSFDLFNLTGDVDLVARLGRLPLPEFDYASFNFGTDDENITLLPDTVPVPLTPGRWYLGVILAEGQPVDYTIQATEYTNNLSAIITLTNGVPYPNTNLGLPPIEDYYRFVVTDPVARLQFEILEATADITLLVSKGLPLPSFASFDYLSANPGTNSEYILVLPGSSPVVASAGEWFLTALNLSGQAADYAIKATQWAETGQPITIGPPSRQAGSFCFDWNSLPGAQYVVQAKVALSDTNWVTHSGTITATDTVTSYCVALPSPYQFFQVIEGVAVDTSSAAQIRIGRITVGPGGVTLQWQAPPTFQFEVQYSNGLPAVWNTAPGGPITSTDGNFTFTDPAPLPGTRLYRIVLLP